MKAKTRQVAVQNGNENIYHYRVVIYRDDDDVFIAECPALEGCMTDGATFEEAFEGIKDAVACYVGALKELGKPIPKEPQVVSSYVSVVL
jgi:predicted RNase H-like HicB family nuclease